MEALIGVHNIIGNAILYIHFLRNQQKIQEVIDDIKLLVKYCGTKTIKDADIEIYNFSKCNLTILYV